jgi:hypothetical protein
MQRETPGPIQYIPAKNKMAIRGKEWGRFSASIPGAAGTGEKICAGRAGMAL